HRLPRQVPRVLDRGPSQDPGIRRRRRLYRRRQPRLQRGRLERRVRLHGARRRHRRPGPV
ncbi:hypothetical protein HK101_010959, partial [Irineochytrium annulatum]